MVASPIINNKKIKIALIGCGRIAEKHFAAISEHSADLELDAICDVNPEALKKAEELTGAKGYLSLDDLLKNSSAELIVLCTPSGLHCMQTCQIASAGRHVITEKPMATRWNDGLNMVKACDEANVRLFVVKQNRFNDTLQLLKRAVIQQRFGKIYLVNVNVFWSRPQSYYDSAKWRGTWEFDGGALMNQASHYIDLLPWLFGPIDAVHAITGTLARNIEAEDTGILNIKWRDGALGSVNVTMLAYPKNIEGSITVLGEKGTVKVGGIAVNEIQHWDFANVSHEDATIKEANYAVSSVYGFGHPRYYENVIKVLHGQADPETDGREGLKSLEVLIAAYLSARSGNQTSLPLEH